MVAGCEEADDKEPGILGIWVFEYWDQNTSGKIYSRHDQFEEDKPGVQFQSNGTLIERGNRIGCGTPPIIYTNYEGSWSYENDSTITITSSFWGGVQNCELQILSLTVDTLKILWDCEDPDFN